MAKLNLVRLSEHELTKAEMGKAIAAGCCACVCHCPCDQNNYNLGCLADASSDGPTGNDYAYRLFGGAAEILERTWDVMGFFFHVWLHFALCV